MPPDNAFAEPTIPEAAALAPPTPRLLIEFAVLDARFAVVLDAF